jgi:hypothetical protein
LQSSGDPPASRQAFSWLQIEQSPWRQDMSRLKLIGAALLLVIFDMYTASADSLSVALPETLPEAEQRVPVEGPSLPAGS